MSDDQEIISRPPSHPIATTLLVVSMIATGLAIFIVWQELFVEYLPSQAPGQAASDFPSRAIAENHYHDHYKRDKGLKHSGNLMADIEAELGIKGNDGGDMGTPTGGMGEDG
jgi:hypothetical protein